MQQEKRSAPRLTLGGDLPVRRIGYGAMHLTGPGMWGPYPDPAHAVAVLRRAVDLGVDFIDTADSYGPGYNERMIRLALHPYPDHLVICTKGGLVRSGPADWAGLEPPYIRPVGRPEYLRQQVEVSLQNLGVDRIDLYQLHSIDPQIPLSEQLGILSCMQEEGKIRHIGLSGQPGVSVEDLMCADAHATVTAVENLYNIADRQSTDVLRHCEKYGTAFIPWFPLGHGTLAASDGPLAKIAAEFGMNAPQLALAWLLHVSPNTLLIPGTTSLAHLEENLRAGDVSLTAQDLEAITRTVDAAGITTWRPGASTQPSHAC
ncbi:aldo/keto reductase [Streptomyces murinus]|uniref:aldo/keto reductase n=1 Tax=Streptomyces murinus TaxID=33900 RepID=UPI0038291791